MTVYANPGYVSNVVTQTAIEHTWGNAIRDRVVNNFATAAARDAAITVPVAGMMCCIDNDTRATLALQQYMGATDTWQPPWNLAWGQLAYAEVTSNQTGIAAVADVTSLTLSITVVANRILVTEWFEPAMQQVTSTGTITLEITDTTPTIKAENLFTQPALNNPATGLVVRREVSSAGTFARKARATTSAGTLTLARDANTNVGAAFIRIVDLGPSGNPA